MMNLKPSPLLQFVMKEAKLVDNKENAPFTVERFIAVLIDMAIGGKYASVPEAKTLDACYTQLQRRNMLNRMTRDLMLEFLKDSASPVRDDLDMKNHMRAVQQELGEGEITPEALLKRVLAWPNVNVSRCIEANKQEQQAKQARKESARKSFEEMLRERAQQAEMEEEVRAFVPDEPSLEEVARISAETATMRDELLGIVLGQNHAVNTVATGLFQARLRAMLGENKNKPLATFLFAGPPGVGKTFLAETTANMLNRPFQRFDMSEYCDKEASIEFCGSDKVYKNGKAGNFTSFVEENPCSVVLFDEVEKAHISIIHQFLQILDAGRIRDNYTDHEISLENVVLFFTTNAGKQMYEESEKTNLSELPRKVILKALEKDINPATGHPFFPAAICSRFATGNVVMFNHMTAGRLRDIAKARMDKQVSNMEKELKLKFTLDPRVYAAMLYAEGGAADARTIRARADNFLPGEIYELFRLMNSEGKSITDLEEVKVEVVLPEEEETRALFVDVRKPRILVFSDETVARACEDRQPQCQMVHVSDVDVAAQKLTDEDIKLVLVDSQFGVRQGLPYLNTDDLDSSANDFLDYLLQRHSDIPVYLLDAAGEAMKNEQIQSYMDRGVRGVLRLDDGFAPALMQINDNMHQQYHMLALAQSHKTVFYGTAQTLSKDGKTARILLTDFRLQVAVEAEDTKSVLSDVSRPSVRFDQVIGAEDAKSELRYFADYLKNPKKYRGTGVQPPKGILLYGPPGTGKTMLAKAMACEANVTFLSAEGNQFLKQLVGQGAGKVHELFRTARKYAPAVLFVDEIDAIAKERGSAGARDTSDVLTAFLTEMDGFKNDPSKPVFVMAATNYDVEPGSERSLDAALMRRFDRRIYIDLPDKKGRIQYIKMKTADPKHFAVSEQMVENLAVRSVGMSLAALASVFELALRTAVRNGTMPVNDEVLENAFELFNNGEEKERGDAQLERVARHEAGHAFLYWQAGQTPSYVTAVARGSHGGYMQHGDEEGKGILTRKDLLDRIRTSLGGRAAELVYYGPEEGLSTGASNDLYKATVVAKQIICNYGMDAQMGLAAMDATSDAAAEKLRAGINQILQQQMDEAVASIQENRAAVDALVKALLEKNHLTGDEIRVIYEENCK